jgi:tetratricopeptide (TPR) repeat protein
LLQEAKHPDGAEEWSEMLDEAEREVSMSQGELEYLFGDLDTSETAYRKALAIAEKQLAADRRNPVLLEGIAAACEGIGAVLLVREKWADSIDVLRRCQAFRAAVAGIDSSDSYKALLVAISDNNLGEALFNGEEVAASLESFSASKRVLEDLCRRAPGNSFQERILAVCEINCAGSLRALGRHAEASEACDRAKALCDKLLSSGKAPQELPVDMAREAYQRGKLAAAAGYAQEAEAQFLKARDAIRQMANDATHPLHRDSALLLRLLDSE